MAMISETSVDHDVCNAAGWVEKANMPMKCIDQIPMPMAPAHRAPASPADRSGWATRPASVSAVIGDDDRDNDRQYEDANIVVAA